LFKHGTDIYINSLQYKTYTSCPTPISHDYIQQNKITPLHSPVHLYMVKLHIVIWYFEKFNSNGEKGDYV